MKTTSQKNTAKGVFNEKTIKQTVPYNLKKVLAGIMLVSVPVFVACEKDLVKPNNNGGNGGNTQPREIKDIVYKNNINLDSTTIKNYLNQNYDICLVPEHKTIFSTRAPTPLRMTANKMRKYWGIAPDRISGKKSDTLYVTPEALNAGAASFWIDTLGNTVLPYQPNKQR